MRLRRTTAIIAIIVLLGAFGTTTAAANSTSNRDTQLSAAAVQAAKTPACRKATKAVKKAWKVREKARFSGSISVFRKADMAWRKAKARKAKACKVAKPVETVATFSGDPRDPRPVGWVRPADGSGLPGSNATWADIPAGCPVTISSYELFSNSSDVAAVLVHIESYATEGHTFTYTLDLVDKDGNVMLDQFTSQFPMNGMSERGTIGWNFQYSPSEFDGHSARPLKLTVLTCEVR